MTSEMEYITIHIVFHTNDEEERRFPKEIISHCELLKNQIDEHYMICNPFIDISKDNFLKYINMINQFFQYFSVKPYIPLAKSTYFDYMKHFVENDFLYYHHLVNIKLSELFHLAKISDFLSIPVFSNLIHIKIAYIFKKYDILTLQNIIETDSDCVIDT